MRVYLPYKHMYPIGSHHVCVLIDGFHSIFSLGNWRTLHHYAPYWLVNIHVTWPFCPPVSMVKDAMESVYMSQWTVHNGCPPAASAYCQLQSRRPWPTLPSRWLRWEIPGGSQSCYTWDTCNDSRCARWVTLSGYRVHGGSTCNVCAWWDIISWRDLEWRKGERREGGERG